MNKEKIVLFVVIAFSLLLRINFEITYQDLYVDKMIQISEAKNLMIGNGLTNSAINSNDFTRISSNYVNKYAPGYSLFIIPFHFITGDYHLAANIMDIFFVVLLFLALILLLNCLNIPPKKQILLFAFLGISFTPFYHLSSTDLISMTFFQWAIYFTVRYLKDKAGYIRISVLTGFLLYLTGFIKYNYYPLMFSVPLAVFIIGYFNKEKQVKLFSVICGGVAMILLLLQSIILKMFSGSMFTIVDETGIFFKNLLSMDVFPFKSFFFYEGLLTNLFVSRPYMETIYILIAAAFSLLVIIETIRFIFKKNIGNESTPKNMIFENQHCPDPKGRLIFCDFPLGIKGKKSQNKENGAFRSGLDNKIIKNYLILGLTVLIINVMFLSFMSLTHKAQAWQTPPWTSVEETRYYSQSMLFIEIIFLTFILFGQYKTKFQKIIYKSVVLIVFAYAGLYWLNNFYNIYVKKDTRYTYNGMYKENIQITDAVKANTEKDKFTVFSSPDPLMNQFVLIFTDIKAINNNYAALMNDTVVKTDKPVILFIASPGNEKDLKNLKKYAPVKIAGFEAYDLYKTEIK